MRNGNEVLEMGYNGWQNYGSYPTYEEWKPYVSFLHWCKFNCSYPTYEEWKLNIIKRKIKEQGYGSYPTYEEWKHATDFNLLCSFESFLSYLWGMET